MARFASYLGESRTKLRGLRDLLVISMNLAASLAWREIHQLSCMIPFCLNVSLVDCVRAVWCLAFILHLYQSVMYLCFMLVDRC